MSVVDGASLSEQQKREGLERGDSRDASQNGNAFRNQLSK
jgi:hypothetical protein